MHKSGLLSTTGLLLLTLIILITLNEWEGSTPRQVPVDEESPEIVFSSVQAINWDQHGQQDAQIAADKMEYFNNQANGFMTRPRIKLKRNENHWLIESESGEADMQARTLQLSGNVIATTTGPSDEQIQIQAQDLFYSLQDRKLVSQGAVTVSTPTGVTHATGMEVDINSGTLVFQQQVRGTYALFK